MYQYQGYPKVPNSVHPRYQIKVTGGTTSRLPNLPTSTSIVHFNSALYINKLYCFRNRSNLVVGITSIEDISYIGFLNEMIYVFGTKTKGL